MDQSEEHISILDGLADPILIHELTRKGPPGKIVFCNRTASEITGYSETELLSMRITELGHPESGLEDQSLSDSILEGEDILFERIIVRKDSTIFPVEVHARLIEYKGKQMVLSLLRDISRRKEDEESTKLHLMFEKIVSNISSRFINMPDYEIDAGIEKTLKEVCDFLGAIRGSIFLINDERTGMTLSHEWCADPSASQKSLIQSFAVEQFSYHASLLSNLEDVVLDSLDDLPPEAEAERKWYKENGFNPSFFVPIMSDDTLVGTMGFAAEDNKSHKWPGQFGNLLRYIAGIFYNAISRKKAEAQLRQSEQEYRNIFENVVDVFYEASLDGTLLNVTPSVEHLTRYKQKDIIGKPMESFYYNPSIRESLLQELYNTGEAVDYELDIRDADGSPVPANLNARIIFDEKGNPERIVGSLADLRKHKKAERQVQQLSTALEQSPVSVLITDLEIRILYANNSFALFSGLKPEEVLGKTPHELTRGQIPLGGYDDLWDSVKKGDIWRNEIEYRKKDDKLVWLSITVSPVLDSNQKCTNFIAILEEVTERKRAEQDLLKAKEQAEKSDHLKSAFLANMSHEIRTPMNAILGFSTLLKEEHPDEEQSEYYIDIINSKGRDLLRIISDIIDISRIEAGDLFIKMEPVEVFPFVREVFTEFKEDAQVKTRKNLQFRLNVPEPEQKMIINTDPSRLKQIFVNLIQNALKFTPEGFVEFGFELGKKNEIRFCIKDSGVGIPDDKKEIIFERFRQIDESHTREYGGTGLGLAICKNLLELMGSELSLKSVQGRGSEFSFVMKYILTEARDEGPGIDETDLQEIDLDIKGKKILIVEDDGTSYLFLEKLLNKYSPELIWAKTGKMALETMQRIGGIDLILMDIRMPEMDGLTATRMIREANPDIPIIAQTAYAQVKDRQMAIESGCNDYLSKPVSPVDLINLLAKYLNPVE